MSTTSFKTIIQLAVVLVVLGILVWFGYQNYITRDIEAPSATSTPTGIISDADARELLKSATVIVPETTTTATLVNGTAEYPLGEGLPLPGSVVLGDAMLVTPTDVFATLVVNSGGTGNFLYLASFRQEDGDLKFKSSAFLGDRIIIDGIVINELNSNGSYTIDVAILDRETNEPMSVQPTVPRTLNFLIEDGLIKGDFFNQ